MSRPETHEKPLDSSPVQPPQAPATPLQAPEEQSGQAAQGLAIEASAAPNMKGIGGATGGGTGAIGGRLGAMPESPRGIHASNSATVVLPPGGWMPVGLFVGIGGASVREISSERVLIRFDTLSSSFCFSQDLNNLPAQSAHRHADVHRVEAETWREWHEGQRPPTPPITDPGILSLCTVIT